MKYKTLKDIGDIMGKIVLVRFDFNVPTDKGMVVDDFRIKQSLPTLEFLKNAGAKIGIIAHIEGESDTLRPVYEYLKKSYDISFCEDCIENGSNTLKHLKNSGIVLFENLRLYDGEKRNDQEFAKKLASFADMYVNDAFSVSHRKHASVVGVPKYLPGFLGFQFEKEVENLSKAFNPPKPFLFILGGAKFDTKLPLVQKFLPLVSTILITGALANDFYKAQGLSIGKSKVSDTTIDLKELLTDPKIVVQPDALAVSDQGKRIIKPLDTKPDESLLDAGTETLAFLAEKARDAKCILWNGTLGNYEHYPEATQEAAKIIAHSSAFSIVGGGDTLAAISKLGLEDKFGFISTGGGAMLDFLAQGTLPGLDALKK